ncbi:hypothetical protein H072_2391 [Dactylellina haptotyla CBS 200.50]|uniref:Uncharacterized protein n=1 Tax=Dactylellina haptotyla (strain CBS 200.50) TaxID=1284197 RepID=S8AKY4_DACHA|nr:hypothetical protein H072_2391 [Dactylellina haptotyla CBS 200.50]
MRLVVLFITVTVFPVAWAAPPSQLNDRSQNPTSNSKILTANGQDESLLRRGTSVSALWYDIPSPTPTPEPKKNVPGAVGATIAAVLIVTIAVVVFLAHRGIWLRHLRAQQTKSKTVLSFRPTSTTPEPVEYDEQMRQQRSGQIVQSYISMETVCISDQESEVGVPVSRLSIHDQYYEPSFEHTVTLPLPVVHRHKPVSNELSGDTCTEL